ncbi:GGDEF domain-containing protein [Caballeronia sp. LZ034LL]|uniref:GGDEF domain-containing protein n=1 Tax=Caballeronia sp. LZ034LL TaxID=3038567 RepID=UPI002860E076|nr:GGDEF domain-containing protein [Caballeronia sp. LZ034LL]MDR5835556.1 GGDEF domain-containing protein [Caballeronia sp. LZ034LL]
MFHTPDTETLRLCSVLTSIAFGLVFALFRFGGRREAYFVHWSASAFLYAAVLIGFDSAPRGQLLVFSLLMGALAATNMLIVSGLRAFDGKPPFRLWMLAPVAGCAVAHVLPVLIAGRGPGTGAWTQAVDTVTIAISAGIAGGILLASGRRDQSRARRIAGLAILGYLPGYAVVLAAIFSMTPRINYLALIPMLSDQLLLGVLNLGLLAIPAERAQQRLRDAALRDPLTGAWNRAGFDRQAGRLASAGATVLAIDLDHFKQINDRHGHLAGDTVLIELARLAGAEVASLGGAFGRLGGDEFVAILPASRAPDAQACASQIHEACRKYTEGMPEWTTSIGVSQIMPGETGHQAALHRADGALYRAKLTGRNKLTA